MRHALGTFFGLTCVCLAFSATLLGQTSPSPVERKTNEPAVKEYRWIDVPETDLPVRARGHMAIERDLFRQQLADINAAASELPRHRAHIRSAVYLAKWEDKQLQGIAILEIEQVGEGPIFLPLNDLSVIIEQGVWESHADTPIQFEANEDGTWGVSVRQSDKLHLRWRQAIVKEREGSVDYARIGLPLTAVGQFRLLLPHERRLRSNAFVHNPATATSMVSDSMELPSLLVGDDSTLLTASEAFSTYVVEIGGRASVELRSYGANDDGSEISAGTYRVQTLYELRQEGLTATFDVNCEVTESSVRSLQFDLPTELQVVNIECATQTGTWHIRPSNRADTSVIRYTFAEPVDAGSLDLRVTTLSTQPLADSRPLPQLVAHALQWREGNAVIRAYAPLEIQQWNVEGGRVTSVKPMSDKNPGEQREVQFYVADNHIELSAQTSKWQASVASGWSISIGGPRMVAEGIIDIRQEHDSLTTFIAEVPLPWQVDTFSSEDPDQIDRWEIVSQDASRSYLEVVLGQPLRPGEILRCRCELSRSGLPQGAIITATELRAMMFPSFAGDQRIVSVTTTSGQLLRHQGSPFLSWLAPEELSADEQTRLKVASNWTYRERDESAEVSLVLAERREEFSARTNMMASFRQDRMVWIADVGLTPASAVPDRLVLHFFNRLTNVPTFTQPSQVNDSLVTRKLSVQEQQQWQLPAGGETWEVSGFQGSDIERIVRVEHVEPFTTKEGSMAIPIVSLPQATAESGVVELRSALSIAATVEAAPSFQAIPTPLHASRTGDGHTFAAYHYEDTSALRNRPADQHLTVRFPSQTGFTPVWVSRMVTHTQFLANGDGLYRVELVVQNRGGTDLLLIVPANANVSQAMVGGIPIKLSLTRQLPLELPPDKSEVLVTLEYSIDGSDWGTFVSLFPAFARVNVPVTEQLWQIDAPNSYHVWQSSSGTSSSTIESGSWIGRFLGNVQLPWVSRFATSDGHKTADWQFVVRSQSSTYCVDFYHRPTFALVAWGFGFVVLAVVQFRLQCSTSRCIVLMLLFAAVALVVPAPFYLLFVGPFWGLAVAICLRLYAMPVRQGETFGGSAPRSTSPQSGHAISPLIKCLGWSLLFVGLQSDYLPGQEANTLTPVTQESELPPPDDPPHTVIAPIDVDGRPTGKYVYPDAEFYHWLRRASEERTQKNRTWWIESTRFRCRLQPDSVSGDIRLTECLAMLKIHTAKSMTRAALPNTRDWLNDQRNLIELDGEKTGLHRNVSGDIEILVPRAGTHAIMVPLDTQQLTGTRRSAFAISIMPHPSAALELLQPDGIESDVGIAGGARSDTITDESSTTLLGAVDTLTLRWHGERNVSLTPATRTRRYTRLQVRPNSVTMETRWDFDFGDEHVSQLVWKIDPHLRVLPPPAMIGTIEVVPHGGDSAELILRLPRPWSGERSVVLTFIAPHISGVGTIKVPEVELSEPHDVTHWFALDVSTSLAYYVEDTGSVSIARNDFVGSWGENIEIDYACESPTGDNLPTIHTEIVQPQFRADSILSLTYGINECLCDLRVDIEPLQGMFFQHLLVLPDGCEVQECFLEARDSRRRIRFAKGDGNRVTIFLPTVETVPHRLVIEARNKTVPDSDEPVPLPHLAGSVEDSYQLYIYRHPRALISVAPPLNWATLTPNGDLPTANRGKRLVSAFRVASLADALGAVRVTENRARVNGLLTTTLQEINDQWWADVECQIQVSNGVCDRVILELSEQFDAAASFTPASAVDRRTLPDGSHRVTITLPEDIADTVMVKSRHKLSAPPSQRFPVVSLLNANEVQSLIRLPEQTGIEPKRWSTRNLYAVAGQPNLYRVGDDLPRLVPQQVSGNNLAPRIPLLKANCRIAEGGASGQLECHAVGVSDGLLLRLDTGCRLLHVTVDGAWIVPIRVSDVIWRLPIGESALPRKIALTFHAPPLPISQHVTQWLPVNIVNAEPEVSLWTITCSPAVNVQAPGQRVDERDAQRESWMAEVAMLGQALGDLPDTRHNVTERWIWEWMEQLHQTRRDLINADDRVDDSRWRDAEEQWIAIHELQTILDPVQGAIFANLPTAPADLSLETNGEIGLKSTTFAVRTPAVWTGFELSGPDADATSERLVAAGGLLGVSCVLAIALANRRLRSSGAIVGQLVWIVIGIAWLVQATPSWLGWLAIAWGTTAILALLISGRYTVRSAVQQRYQYMR